MALRIRMNRGTTSTRIPAWFSGSRQSIRIYRPLTDRFGQDPARVFFH
jgi:hypothetical protein